jgi:hypothetical protein
MEQNGVAGALERCRVLAEQIRAGVRDKEPEGLDVQALAEFLVALQCAASVVSDLARLENSGKEGVIAPSPNLPPPPDEPPAPVGS